MKRLIHSYVVMFCVSVLSELTMSKEKIFFVQFVGMLGHICFYLASIAVMADFNEYVSNIRWK